MNSLQCFKDKEKLIAELMNTKHNTEKVVYFLLLDRKLRNPSVEDDLDVRHRSESADPPRKRVDAVQFSGQARKASLSGSPSTSPLSSPKLSRAGRSTPSHSPSATPPGSPSIQTTPWKSRLHTIKNSFLGSPRFHRRKMQGEERGREGWKDRNDGGGGAATSRGINTSDGGDSSTNLSEHITNLLLPSNGSCNSHLFFDDVNPCPDHNVQSNSAADAVYIINDNTINCRNICICCNHGGHNFGSPDHKDTLAARNGYGTSSRPESRGGNSRHEKIQDGFRPGARTNTEGREYLSPPASPNLNIRTAYSPLRDREDAAFAASSRYNSTSNSPPTTTARAPYSSRGNDYTPTPNTSATALRDRDFIGIRVNNVGVNTCHSSGNNNHNISTAVVREREYLSMRNSILGSPRFHRRNMPVYLPDLIETETLTVPTSDEINMTPESSPELAKRSWFGGLMGMEQEHHFVMVREKSFSQVKADLVHAFLSTCDLSHCVVSTTTFRGEYRRGGGSSVFSRNVRFQVDISPAPGERDISSASTFCLTFTLVSGPSRRFRRVCEHLQALMSSPRGENHRKISTDSTVSYCSELVPASYCSSAKENGDADNHDRERKPPLPPRNRDMTKPVSRKALADNSNRDKP